MNGLFRVFDSVWFEKTVPDSKIESDITFCISELLRRKEFDFKKYGGPFGWRIWDYLCTFRYYDSIKLLVDNGMDVNATCPGGFTALHCNYVGEEIKCAQLVLSKGADINATSVWGYTPLRLACMRGNPEYTAFLIKNGADINVENKVKGFGNYTALMYARGSKCLSGPKDEDYLKCEELLILAGTKSEQFVSTCFETNLRKRKPFKFIEI